GSLSPEELRTTQQELKQFLKDFRDWQGDRQRRLFDNGRQLEDALRDAAFTVGEPEFNPREVEKELTKVRNVGIYLQNATATLHPPGQNPLSALRGPAANLSPEQVRRDAQGQPQLPAENVAYLGRSLFTDYLLAVELGGTLLLAATIGAIAIAGR